jgi:Porin PorA
MRKGFGAVLIGIGFFGIVLAILLPTVVVAKSKKTPLDLNITQISSGPAKLLDAATGKTNDVTLRATRTVRTDSSRSNGTNTTVDETLCIVVETDPTMPNCVKDSRLLSYTTDVVTANRKSAESVHVNGWGENVNGDTSVRHTGLSYKWPIDAEKKTYQFYQPDLKKAFPAKFIGTATVRGLEVYKYESATGDQPYKVQGLFDGTYNDTRTVWVEPLTGAIVNGTEHQVQKIGDQVALDTTLSFEKSAIDFQSNFAQGKIDDLNKAKYWGPIGAGVIGIAALIGAYFLLRSRRNPGGHAQGRTPDPDDEPNYDDGPLLAGSNSQT